MAWRFAIWPTSRSPFSVNPTTDGVVRFPSALAMTTGSPPDMMATQEFVVPRSIPITLPMAFSFPSPLNHERPNNQPLGRRFHRRVPAFVRTARGDRHRSEEHTSELQSQSNLVCRLLLEKKKENNKEDTT